MLGVTPLTLSQTSFWAHYSSFLIVYHVGPRFYTVSTRMDELDSVLVLASQLASSIQRITSGKAW